MESIGTIQPRVAAPTLPAPGKAVASSTASAPAADTAAPAPDPVQKVDLQAAEQRRQEAVRQAANAYVISDHTFSIFKDGSGQYITRFTNLRNGQVTYIPEPELFKRTSGGAAPGGSIELQA